jgi:hypothetical protein
MQVRANCRPQVSPPAPVSPPPGHTLIIIAVLLSFTLPEVRDYTSH